MVVRWPRFKGNVVEVSGLTRCGPFERHSGEPRIRSGAGAGIQHIQELLDPGFRRGDGVGNSNLLESTTLRFKGSTLKLPW
jgi:hypothetical protein